MNQLTTVLFLLAIVGVAHAADVEDSRFAHPYDKDHPWDFSPQFQSRDAWEARRDFLRHQALVAQGLWPEPTKTPLNPTIHGKIDRDTYTIEKAFFASIPGHYVSGNLYRPRNRSGKVPGILAPYGHWPDGRFWWRDDPGIDKEIKAGAEVDRESARSPLQANCAMLARMGCVVFQYDMVGYCDSTAIKHREGFLDAEAILRCQSFMGLQTWNSIRSLDFLLSLPDIDAERIGITGSSSGGSQTMALNACDPRATAAFPMVMVSMNMQGGCVCENAPLYRVCTNNVELACLFAPKPEGMAAANDWTIDFLTRGLPEMKKIWGLYGAEAQVSGEHYNFPHNHNLHARELQYNFFNKQFRLALPEPVKEVPPVLVPPKELSVYDEQHPRPSDEVDAAALRKYMTHDSDQQLGAMSPEQYAQAVRFALQAMVVDHKPSADECEFVGDTFTPPSGGGTWTGAIARRGSGERVPCKIIVPANWNKSAVLWAHPDGCKSLSTDNPSAKKLLDAGMAIVTIDWFGSEAFKATSKPTTQPRQRGNPNPPYAAYTIGYERSVIANRVHDLLTAFGTAQTISKDGSIDVIAFGECGPIALLTCAVAEHHITRAAIDLNEFDFDRITSDNDPMLLPGALKYGGIFGFAPLIHRGQTLLVNARHTGRFDLAKRNPAITIDDDQRDRLAEWLIKPD